MKKILSILAIALMASASFLASAGTLSGHPHGNDVFSNDPSVTITYNQQAVTLVFSNGRINWISIENWNTGEYHAQSVRPSCSSVVTVPFSMSNGTWEINATYIDGRTYYGRFVISNSNNGPLTPVDWINDGNPNGQYIGPELP